MSQVVSIGIPHSRYTYKDPRWGQFACPILLEIRDSPLPSLLLPYSPKWDPLASLLLNKKATEGLDSTLDRQHLTKLEEDIERLTLESKADISSIYHTVPSLITLFMESKEPTAQLMNRSISLDDRILINSLAYEKDTHVKHFQPPVPPRLPCYDFTPGPSSEPHPILLTPAN